LSQEPSPAKALAAKSERTIHDSSNSSFFINSSPQTNI
jgi:hypothetical protein